VTSRELLALAAIGAPAVSGVALAVVPELLAEAVAKTGAVLSALAAGALAAVTLTMPGSPLVERWLVVDAAAGLLIAVIGVVGLASVLTATGYLSSTTDSLVQAKHRSRVFYGLLFAFWAILAAIPLIGNLAGAWLLVEATTAASALLVGFSGRPRALEAAWKYLILTSLGLSVALLGIMMLAAQSTAGGLDALSWRELSAVQPGQVTLVAYLLLLAGLAAKIGWAPVHNWLPDAHSEAPAPVSALLSAALLPTALLVAWRSSQALAPVLGESTTHGVLVGFGLLSLAVAVPFLWRPLPWKRLLAYSSLEHMGVIALGIGFGTPLALAGVAVHIAGHAVAKASGFYAATPLLSLDPRAGTRATHGVLRTQAGLGSVLGGSLAALAGLPPSPLFVSEVMIVAGGFEAGRPWTAAASAILLALGFLGLAHALIETTSGRATLGATHQPAGLRVVLTLGAVAGVLLLALTVAAVLLPDSAIAHALVRGAG
jgi:hydrogenase-4 component F